MGRGFEKRLGVNVVADSMNIQSGDKRIYMAHGDMFCADDHLYRIFRRVIRSAPLRFLSQVVPLGLTLGIAEQLRNISQKEIARKDDRTMRLSEELVTDVFKQGFDVCVLGHVHKPQVLSYQVGDRTCTLITLGHWDDGISYIEMSDGRFHLFDGSPGNFREISPEKI